MIWVNPSNQCKILDINRYHVHLGKPWFRRVNLPCNHRQSMILLSGLWSHLVTRTTWSRPVSAARRVGATKNISQSWLQTSHIITHIASDFLWTQNGSQFWQSPNPHVLNGGFKPSATFCMAPSQWLWTDLNEVPTAE